VDTVDSDWIVIGRFGRPHGIKGSISVLSFTEPRENILQYPCWYIKRQDQWHPLKRQHDDITQKHILTQVLGYEEREDVAALTNLEIGVPRSELPRLDVGEYYWHELIGMRVIHCKGDILGDVTEMMATGSNDVLIVQGEQRYLIPYLPNETVLSVDIKKREITIDWDLDF
jgi:16S rRNA processing protein RimM